MNPIELDSAWSFRNHNYLETPLMKTHTPFLFAHGLVYAAGDMQADGRVCWKLHWNTVRIDTGLPEDTIECSPSVDEEMIIFIGQCKGDYRFYRCNLRDGISAEPIAICGRTGGHAGTRNGFLEAVSDDAEGLIHIHSRAGDMHIRYMEFTLQNVARLSFLYERPYVLTVSGLSVDNTYRTVTFNLKNNEKNIIRLADGSDVYKASIYGDKMAYAERGRRLSESFEDREVLVVDRDRWRLEALDTKTREMDYTERDRVRECLAKNCETGKFCRICRNHPPYREGLKQMGIVDEHGNGCPRNLPWDAEEEAFLAIRKGHELVWCDSYGAGVSPRFCDICAKTKMKGGDERIQKVMELAALRRKWSCIHRVWNGKTTIRDCCGRESQEVKIWECTLRSKEVLPKDCAGCNSKSANGGDLCSTRDSE